MELQQLSHVETDMAALGLVWGQMGDCAAEVAADGCAPRAVPDNKARARKKEPAATQFIHTYGSKLIEVLGPLVGGNAKTYILGSVSTSPAQSDDTVSLLDLSQRALGIAVACKRFAPVKRGRRPQKHKPARWGDLGWLAVKPSPGKRMSENKTLINAAPAGYLSIHGNGLEAISAITTTAINPDSFSLSTALEEPTTSTSTQSAAYCLESPPPSPAPSFMLSASSLAGSSLGTTPEDEEGSAPLESLIPGLANLPLNPQATAAAAYLNTSLSISMTSVEGEDRDAHIARLKHQFQDLLEALVSQSETANSASQSLLLDPVLDGCRAGLDDLNASSPQLHRVGAPSGPQEKLQSLSYTNDRTSPYKQQQQQEHHQHQQQEEQQPHIIQPKQQQNQNHMEQQRHSHHYQYQHVHLGHRHHQHHTPHSPRRPQQSQQFQEPHLLQQSPQPQQPKDQQQENQQQQQEQHLHEQHLHQREQQQNQQTQQQQKHQQHYIPERHEPYETENDYRHHHTFSQVDQKHEEQIRHYPRAAKTTHPGSLSHTMPLRRNPDGEGSVDRLSAVSRSTNLTSLRDAEMTLLALGTSPFDELIRTAELDSPLREDLLPKIRAFQDLHRGHSPTLQDQPLRQSPDPIPVRDSLTGAFYHRGTPHHSLEPLRPAHSPASPSGHAGDLDAAFREYSRTHASAFSPVRDPPLRTTGIDINSYPPKSTSMGEMSARGVSPTLSDLIRVSPSSTSPSPTLPNDSNSFATRRNQGTPPSSSNHSTTLPPALAKHRSPAPNPFFESPPRSPTSPVYSQHSPSENELQMLELRNE
jgi:hypothetical protein